MADGSPGPVKNRYDTSDGGPKFHWWHYDRRGRHRCGKGPSDPLLYNLPAVLAAVLLGTTVWLCEGEKDADALIALGLVATTTANGAGSFSPEVARLLLGAHVNVVLDCDQAGRNRARLIADALAGKVASLRLVVPAAGKDAYDHLVVHGLDVDDFVETLPVRFATSIKKVAPSGNQTTTDIRGNRLADQIQHDRIAKIRSSVVGDRNNTTSRNAWYVLRLANGGHFDPQAIEAQIEAAALQAGLPRAEIKSILKSAAKGAKKAGPLHFANSQSWHDSTTDPRVLSIEAAIDRFAWRGKHGHHCRRVLLAVIEVLRRNHYPHSKFPASHYDIAHEANTKAMDSLRRALKTLQEMGWLKPIRAGTRDGRPSIWALTLPAQSQNDCPETTPFLDSSSGSYSQLRISHPAFLPMCWGSPAHRVLRGMSATESRSVAEIAARCKIAASTVRRSLCRMARDGAVIGTAGGWHLTRGNLVGIADQAAGASGAAKRCEAIRSHLERRQANYRIFLTWKRTPVQRRPALESRTAVRLVLEAA